MGLIDFSEVGSQSLGSDSIFSVKPLPSFADVHASSIVEFIEVTLPQGTKSNVKYIVTGVTPVITSVRENIFGNFPSTSTSNILFVNAGLSSVRVDRSGNLQITNANLFNHPDRVSNPGAFPSSVANVTVSNSGVGENEVFYLTIIRSPHPNIVAQEVQNVTIEPYTIGVEVVGTVLLDEVSQFVVQSDPSRIAQPDISAPCVTGIDFELSGLSLEKSSVTRYESFKVLVTLKNVGTNSFDSLPTVDGNGKAIVAERCYPGPSFQVRSFGGTWRRLNSSGAGEHPKLKPGQSKEFVITASLAEFAQVGSYDIRVKLENSSYCNHPDLKDPITKEFIDDNLNNNEVSTTISLVANQTDIPDPPGPKPSSGGGGTSLEPTAEQTSSQVTCIFNDSKSFGLYGFFPSEEFQSDYIETVTQACRVAEKIVWERNQVLETSFSVPYNPDVFVGQTVEVRYREADFSIFGIVKSVGHTFTTGGEVATQVVVRSTEYVFDSLLGSASSEERVDQRQLINVGQSDTLTSF